MVYRGSFGGGPGGALTAPKNAPIQNEDAFPGVEIVSVYSLWLETGPNLCIPDGGHPVSETLQVSFDSYLSKLPFFPCNNGL